MRKLFVLFVLAFAVTSCGMKQNVNGKVTLDAPSEFKFVHQIGIMEMYKQLVEVCRIKAGGSLDEFKRCEKESAESVVALFNAGQLNDILLNPPD